MFSIDLKKMEVIENIDWYGEGFEKVEDKRPSALYSAAYTTDGSHILAGGTSPNEVRIFRNNEDGSGHKVVSSISDLNAA